MSGPSGGRTDDGEDVPRDARQHDALAALHHAARGIDRGGHPGFRRVGVAEALREIAGADVKEVPISARLHALHGLAEAGFPGYDENAAAYLDLAASVGGAGPEQLLEDLKASAGGKTRFAATTSGQALKHRDVAFVGEQVCQIKKVTVGGREAVWIYSEFETDAAFEDVAAWVRPQNWPQHSPMMFKKMELVGAEDPLPIEGLGTEHWHGVFHEEVQLVKRVNTLLHCVYWQQGDTSAAMTYDLDFSADGEIDVDRGFLSVNDVDGMRKVRALKIVGFTTNLWDSVAQTVCPFWTDWVRGAVETGSTSRPADGPPQGTGGDKPRLDLWEEWVDLWTDSARAYADLFGDVSDRSLKGPYSSSDWVADGTRYWSQIAGDWSRVWSLGIDAVDAARRPGPRPPRPTPGTGRATSVRLAADAAAGPPKPSDLVSIGAQPQTIPASRLAVAHEGAAVTVGEPAGRAAPGLYVGSLQSGGGGVPTPFQLYVSGAEEATT